MAKLNHFQSVVFKLCTLVHRQTFFHMHCSFVKIQKIVEKIEKYSFFQFKKFSTRNKIELAVWWPDSIGIFWWKPNVSFKLYSWRVPHTLILTEIGRAWRHSDLSYADISRPRKIPSVRMCKINDGRGMECLMGISSFVLRYKKTCGWCCPPTGCELSCTKK